MSDERPYGIKQIDDQISALRAELQRLRDPAAIAAVIRERLNSHHRWLQPTDVNIIARDLAEAICKRLEEK